MRGDEHSEASIDDPEIVEYLIEQRSRGAAVTLICNHIELAGNCKVQKLPIIFLPDLVLGTLLNARKSASMA
jgi:hypothetical protein